MIMCSGTLRKLTKYSSFSQVVTDGSAAPGGGAGSRVVASSGERVNLEWGAREHAREIIRKDAAGGTALCRRWLEAPTLPCD